MPQHYKTIRITEEAHHALRQLYINTGETLTEIASRIILAARRPKPPKPQRKKQ